MISEACENLQLLFNLSILVLTFEIAILQLFHDAILPPYCALTIKGKMENPISARQWANIFYCFALH